MFSARDADAWLWLCAACAAVLSRDGGLVPAGCVLPVFSARNRCAWLVSGGGVAGLCAWPGLGLAVLAARRVLGPLLVRGAVPGVVTR